MKKLILALVLIMTCSMIYGQRNNRTTAFNYLRNNELDKAREYIDKTIEHPQTIHDARSWFYRGNIYLSIHMSDDPEYKDLIDNPLLIAYESYIKAKEYDDRQRYYTDIISNILVISEQLYNEGVMSYNDDDFMSALKAFQLSAEASELLGAIDTTAVYNIALTAEIAGEYGVAKETYNKLISMEHDIPDVYTALGRVHMAEGDTATALDFIVSGREKYPEDFNLLINEINIYLLSDNVEKAVDQLELAVEKDDTNPTIFFAVGVAYDQLRTEQPEKSDEFFVKAENAYNRALELNPTFFDANYNLGALYVNEAAVLIEEANKIPFPYPNKEEEKRYEHLIEKATDYLNKSMPKLEQALEIQPNDFNTMVSLKEIYTRLNKLDKLQEIDRRIKEYQERN
jgi:tetratricopeptide (TPR) repeat protein